MILPRGTREGRGTTKHTETNGTHFLFVFVLFCDFFFALPCLFVFSEGYISESCMC